MQEEYQASLKTCNVCEGKFDESQEFNGCIRCHKGVCGQCREDMSRLSEGCAGCQGWHDTEFICASCMPGVRACEGGCGERYCKDCMLTTASGYQDCLLHVCNHCAHKHELCGYQKPGPRFNSAGVSSSCHGYVSDGDDGARDSSGGSDNDSSSDESNENDASSD